MKRVKFEDLAEELKNIAYNVVRDVVDTSVDQMKTLAPVDTGELRDSIGTQLTGTYKVIIGASTEYAPYVEFGTETTQPQPFVRPTVDSIDAIIKRALQK